jgi:hypothetical protein
LRDRARIRDRLPGVVTRIDAFVFRSGSAPG